jgi:hypothetical protein
MHDFSAFSMFKGGTRKILSFFSFDVGFGLWIQSVDGG